MAKKMHAGFPEKALDKFACILVENNYKVCVVEQIETKRELDGRLKAGGVAKNDKCIKRDVVNVLTKGTYCDPLKEGFEPRYLWVIMPYKTGIVFCSAEIFLGVIEIGVIEEDSGLTHLKMLISQQMPKEVIYDLDEFDTDQEKLILKILRELPTRP